MTSKLITTIHEQTHGDIEIFQIMLKGVEKISLEQTIPGNLSVETVVFDAYKLGELIEALTSLRDYLNPHTHPLSHVPHD